MKLKTNFFFFFVRPSEVQMLHEADDCRATGLRLDLHFLFFIFFHCTVLYLSRTDSMFNVSEPSAERESRGGEH